jgi:hypothetical protein
MRTAKIKGRRPKVVMRKGKHPRSILFFCRWILTKNFDLRAGLLPSSVVSDR